MDSSYLLHRAQECQRITQVLRETIERQIAPNEAIDSKLSELELELKLLTKQLKEK